MTGTVDLDRKVAFLTRPESYPEETTSVEPIETHMAWVFLTDRHAYKMKKPVRYDYLDFATLEARRRDCEEEVRLNRRLAPDVYLGTVSLVVDERDRLRLAEPGREVERLVEMRRLPRDRMLDAMIEAEAVDEEDVRAFAGVMADFYRRRDPVPVDPGEHRRAFERDVRENRAELQREEFDLPRGMVREVFAYLLGSLEDEGERLEERVEEERIVEAHGDLRPEHVCLLEPPVVIDCLEFNLAFRLLDPADELAFLSIECERLRADWIGPLVFRLVNGELGDAPPAELVRFYMVHRATLRAKIAAWHLLDEDVQDPIHWREQAIEYLNLARSHLP